MTSVEETRQVIDRYLHGRDMSVLAENAVFEVMASGQRAHGRAAIEQLMEYFYTKAFTAEFTPKSVTIGEGKAVLEADFHGKQSTEFAGIQPSGKEVHVPLCVCYDVSDRKITHARIYFETDAIRMQK